MSQYLLNSCLYIICKEFYLYLIGQTFLYRRLENIISARHIASPNKIQILSLRNKGKWRWIAHNPCLLHTIVNSWVCPLSCTYRVRCWYPSKGLETLPYYKLLISAYEKILRSNILFFRAKSYKWDLSEPAAEKLFLTLSQLVKWWRDGNNLSTNIFLWSLQLQRFPSLIP